MNRIPHTPGTPVGPADRIRPMFAVTDAVLATSERLLRSPLWKGRESIVYWAGLKRDDVWLATTVIKPCANRTEDSFATSAQDNREVVEFLSEAGLALLAQVHTHPGSSVGHSAGDDEDAFMPKEHALSIVVGHYGRRGMRPLDRCGVHRYEKGRFRRLAPAEIATDICVVPLSRNLARGRSR